MTTNNTIPKSIPTNQAALLADTLKERAQRIGLWGLLAEWSSVSSQPWLATVIEYEELARAGRSLERRTKMAKLGAFKPIADFDWTWPKEIDRELLDEVFTLDFVGDAANIIIIGSNGTGKTMIAKNLAHQTILRGGSALFVTASALLNDLADQHSAAALTRRLRYYLQPQVLVIDELGYLATSGEHADLLFELITRRYQLKSTIITSNNPYTDWTTVFPNASCVVALVDRLIHKAEVITIDAESYRLKDAQERASKRIRKRTTTSRSAPNNAKA